MATIPIKRTRTTKQETEPDAGERQETPDGEEQESQQSAAEEMQDAEGETDAAEMDAQQIDMDDMPDDMEGEEEPDGEEPWRPQLALLVALERGFLPASTPISSTRRLPPRIFAIPRN